MVSRGLFYSSHCVGRRCVCAPDGDQQRRARVGRLLRSQRHFLRRFDLRQHVRHGINGTYDVAGYVVEPSADVFALWESQGNYIDTLGGLHDSRDFSTGRVALGGKVTAPHWVEGVMPYLGLYADWRFASDDAVVADVPDTGIGDGWSARVTGGFSLRVLTAGSLSLSGEYGGIGADYSVWTGTARLTVPF